MSQSVEVVVPSRYPRADRVEIGSVVAHVFYVSHADALRASAVAEEVAAQQAVNGKEFGYNIPGQIVKWDDGTFRVTVP